MRRSPFSTLLLFDDIIITPPNVEYVFRPIGDVRLRFVRDLHSKSIWLIGELGAMLYFTKSFFW